METLDGVLACELFSLYPLRSALLFYVCEAGQEFRAICGGIWYLGDEVHHCGVRYEGLPRLHDTLDQVDWAAPSDWLGLVGWQGGTQRALCCLHGKCD